MLAGLGAPGVVPRPKLAAEAAAGSKPVSELALEGGPLPAPISLLMPRSSHLPTEVNTLPLCACVTAMLNACHARTMLVCTDATIRSIRMAPPKALLLDK